MRSTKLSAQQSNLLLRSAVHAELSALLQGPLAQPPAQVVDFLSDPTLIATVARLYRAQQPDAPTGGRAAVITAGVPGAGKSSALQMIANGFRRIDPDEIKEMLLVMLDGAGLLDQRLDYELADRLTVSPGELAGWVHRASTDAADRVRAASLQLGENFVMEGTLSWPELPARHVDELALGGYEQLTIIDIEVPLPVAIAQSTNRWWQARHSGLITAGVRLGGRFIAESTLTQLYSGPRTASICASNTRALYAEANAAGIETDAIIVSRTVAGAEYKARLTAGGAAEPCPGAPLGAVCLNCGAILKNAAAIVAGTGGTHRR